MIKKKVGTTSLAFKWIFI